MWVLCRHENVSAQQYCGLEVGEETTRTIKQTIYNSKLFILMRIENYLLAGISNVGNGRLFTGNGSV